jgi:membrane-bound lytic murein transglycosylase D
MKLQGLLAACLLWCLPVLGQDDTVGLDDLLRGGLQWLQENVDEDVLRSFGEVDQQKVRQFLAAVQTNFHGEYVVDVAALKQAAAVVLPLLEGHPETRAYASWLRSRMDYFEVAEHFRLVIPPPKVEPGQPPKPAPNPQPELQRQVWQKQLEQRPLPKGAALYVPRLKPIFAARKIPRELVWLAEVESGFDPQARSPVGAAGLFQFMPRTGQALGLSLRPADERLDSEKSADAAAKYLKLLYGQFKDWRLALAAYNAGEGSVRNLLTKYKARSFDAISRHLPAETQMYVPKIEATLLRREGVKLANLAAPGA